jgi:eukaryotic-like serine/threonine-protein kinase
MDDSPQDPPEPQTVADMDSDPGDTKKMSTVGRYVILDSIGMGGMGLVCSAYDPKLNRRIALKLLRNASNDEASTFGRNRLFREAQALAKLSHPNVVTVHDVDVFEGQVYIAMEFVEGTTLREWLRDEPRTWKEILHKFILAGRGLAAAHAADIIHRDFKPSNVLIKKEGDVRVADFGVAKERDRQRPDPERDFAEFERRRRTIASGEAADATAEDALIEEIQSNVSIELTLAGRLVGTPAYMAPEQHMGLRVGPHTDQYSFCVSFYEALYGRLPFEGTDRRDQLTKMTEGRLPPPPKEGGVANVPSWLHKIIARGLRPHPSERWPSMEALLAALERDPAKRARRLGVAAVFVVGAVAAAAAFVLSRGGEPENPCIALGDEVEQHWNSEQHAAIEAAFARSSKPYADDAARRVISTFNRWARDWRATKVEICEATQAGAQSSALLDVRMDCLDQRAREVTAILRVLGEADDEIVEKSVSAAHNLGDPRACSSARAMGEFEHRALSRLNLEQIEEMTADLDHAYALASLGKNHESLPLRAAVVARAEEPIYARTRMRALYDLSHSQFETGDTVGGEASVRQVITLAATLNDPKREAEAWNRLLFHLGAWRTRTAEGRVWALAAESAMIRAGDDVGLKIRYESSVAELAMAEGDRDAGVAHYADALALARAEYGEDHFLTIMVMTNLGVAFGRASRYDEATKVLLEAIARSKEIYGPAHPQLASLYLNLGNVHIASQRHEEAEVALRAALDIREQIGGPRAVGVAMPLHALGKVARDQGRLDEALEIFERVVEIFIEAHGESSVTVAAVVTDIGAVQHRLGHYDDARESFDRVQAIYNVIYPEGHRYVGGLMKRRCALFIDAKLFADAVAACEIAIEVTERFGVELDAKRKAYELLIKAERGRGHAAAAERAQARLDELLAELADAEPSDTSEDE